MNNAFLATTALEQYWDTALPVIFLNDGARRFRRRQHWQSIEHTNLAFVWPLPSEREAEYLWFCEAHEKLLRSLADGLNNLHGTGHSLRYWRIMLSAWLGQYLTMISERHAGLLHAAKSYPHLKLIGLPPNHLEIASDSHEFALWSQADEFNLGLYGEMARELELPCEISNIVPNQLPRRPVPRGRYAAIRFFLNRVMHAGRTERSVLLRESYFDNASLVKLALLSGGRIRPVNPPVNTMRSQPSGPLRAALGQITAQAGTDRIAIANRLIARYLPTTFLEGYANLCRDAVLMYPSKPKAIFTVNALYYDEAFKHWAANSAEHGSRILGGQHGGNFGVVRYLQGVEFELMATDRFYTWGHAAEWQGVSGNPMPATKFMALRARKGNAISAMGPILMGGAITSRFVQYAIPSCAPQSFAQYLDWQLRFIAALDRASRARLRYRAHQVDLGWDVVERLHDRFPGLELDRPEQSFRASLERCSLFVCDYIGTIYAESLAAGVPTILFWDPALNQLTPEADPVFDEMRTMGILHDTPEGAALEIAAMKGEIDGWWRVPARQQAVQRFTRQFARGSRNALREWLDEFDQALH